VAVFDGVPLVAIPANLLAAPLVGPLTITGLVGGLVGGIVGPHGVVGATTTVVPTLLASAVLWIARAGAAVPVLLDGWTLALVTVGVAGAITATFAARFAAGSARRATWRRDPPRDARALGRRPPMAVPPR
jgi:competence protein ComEC